ncbi:hypothetical protein [Listeria booriae]|uniref:hypothetical protein n=1 Tax=Listeria booriae TaxID=1552123 RepID=UPI001625D07F|nr:hypothetical protein [Listeria booriae]MBC1247354.1 hypothetical protein [Listeria booriae]
MAVKVFNFDGDAYIEGEDTRSQIGSLVSSTGNGVFGTIVQVGATNMYTIKAGTVMFIGGLCVRIVTEESFDLTNNKYIVVETTYNAVTGAYSCSLKAVSVITAGKVGTVDKQVIIYEKGKGVQNESQGVADLLKKSTRATRLFNGASYLDEGHKMSFPDVQAGQYQMLFLVFSHYTVGTGADDWGWLIYPIPVSFIAAHYGMGHSIPIMAEDTTKMMYKYVYTGLLGVSGSSNNIRVLDGINFRTKCLREIWGVG